MKIVRVQFVLMCGCYAWKLCHLLYDVGLVYCVLYKNNFDRVVVDRGLYIIFGWFHDSCVNMVVMV